MSWAPLAPETIPLGTAVTLAAYPATRTPASMVLTFRLSQLEGCEFLKPGGSVKVLEGSQEHAGLLRIVPVGSFTLLKAGGKRGLHPTVWLRVPLLKGVMLAAKRAARVVEYDYGSGWLEVTLPEWAHRPALGAPKAPGTGSGGYVPLSNRTPDPAAEARARR